METNQQNLLGTLSPEETENKKEDTNALSPKETENKEETANTSAPKETENKIETNQQDLFGALGIPKVEKKEEIKKQEEKTSFKKKTSSKKETSSKKKEEEFKGTRIVRVYGTELFREEDNSVTLEQLRQRIEEEFGFPEFTKDVTIMTLDKTTGIVVPVRKFGSKG